MKNIKALLVTALVIAVLLNESPQAQAFLRIRPTGKVGLDFSFLTFFRLLKKFNFLWIFSKELTVLVIDPF